MIPSYHFRSKATPAHEPLSRELRLWILRILVPLSVHKDFLMDDGFHSDEVATMIGLGHWIEAGCDQWPDTPTRQRISSYADEDGERYASGYDRKQVLKELRKLHAGAEGHVHKCNAVSPLTVNIDRISELVGLSAVESAVLRFVVTLHSNNALSIAALLLGNLTTSRLLSSLCTVLVVEEDAMRQALSASGALCRSGLLTVERNGPESMDQKLQLLSHHFADYIVTAETQPLDLLRDTVAPSPAAQLAMADFAHVQESLRTLLPYLRHVQQTMRKGVNIYIYGPPGTGKTELARTLAATLGCDLFQVSSEDEEGDSITATRRLKAFRVAQSMLAARKAMLVFDEAEDVFDDGQSFFGPKSTAQTHKAWINRMLEDNSVPTLWLSNGVSSLDPAFVRRFDMVIELPIAPRKQRQRIMQAVCGDVADDAVLARMADSCALAPAVAARAASVVRGIAPELGPQQTSKAFEQLVNATLQAQGHAQIVRNDPSRLPAWYSPQALNADADLAKIAHGLQRTRQGRLALYGPPGTGKTAYGRWIAQELDAPLVVRRGSDLMSMWVGESEKQIAQAFRDAERESAVLLIDEVDGFLQDRRNASRSWEVTQVNEFLTQMENFSGLFIASTNLLTGLDQAALRRFDIKVKFNYLLPEQAWAMLVAQCAALELSAVCDALRPALARLRNLTPGDFAAVARQHRFSPLATASELVAALQQECALKEDTQAAIGFV